MRVVVLQMTRLQDEFAAAQVQEAMDTHNSRANLRTKHRRKLAQKIIEQQGR